MDGFPSKKQGVTPAQKPKAKHPIDGPIPGESLTKPPKSMPFDRPPQFVEAKAALDDVFQKLMSPKVAKRTLAMLDTGMPISTATDQFLKMGFAEGKYSFQILPQMAAPVALMLAKMAHEAGLDVNYTPNDMVKDKKRKIDPAMIAAAQARSRRNKGTRKDVPSGGFMSPPSIEGLE